MTICVSVKVSEGLVLAADSAAVVQGIMKKPSGETHRGVLKTYEHSRKLSQIKDYPIGTLTWGTSLIGARSIESLIREYEYSLPTLEEEREKLKERRLCEDTGLNEQPRYRVQEIAEGLLKHVSKHYEAEFADSDPPGPDLGILVSGYSSGEFFPKQWRIDLPGSRDLIEERPNRENKPDFGANCFGLTDAFTRLHWGRDDKAVDILARHFKVGIEEIRELLAELQYSVFFDGMPLQDAIDYAVYLVNVVIGRFRFVVGAPLCGGEIDVAVITPNALTWVQRKSWAAKNLY